MPFGTFVGFSYMGFLQFVYIDLEPQAYVAFQFKYVCSIHSVSD